MVVRTRKRSVRYRGSKTHGGGSMKKRRGAGNRGGRGMAGTGARGDAKKPSVWKTYKGGKDPSKKGFSSRFEVSKTINVGHLSSIAETLVATGKALEQSGSIVINLRELGISKLLGAGRVGQKLKIGVACASPSAKAKIEKLGGTLDAVIVDKETVKAERAVKSAEKKAKIKKKKPAAEEKPAKETLQEKKKKAKDSVAEKSSTDAPKDVAEEKPAAEKPAKEVKELAPKPAKEEPQDDVAEKVE